MCRESHRNTSTPKCARKHAQRTANTLNVLSDVCHCHSSLCTSVQDDEDSNGLERLEASAGRAFLEPCYVHKRASTRSRLLNYIDCRMRSKAEGSSRTAVAEPAHGTN